MSWTNKLGEFFNRSLDRLILLGVLLVSVPRIAAVMEIVEPPLAGHDIGWLTGIGYGLLMELSLFRLFSTWAEMHKRGRKYAGWLLAGSVWMLALIILILAPHIIADVRQISLEGLLVSTDYNFDVFWSALVVVVPASAAVLLALVEWFSRVTVKDSPSPDVVSNLKNSLSVVESETSQLRTDISQLTETVPELQAQVSMLDEKVSVLEIRPSDLSEELSKVKEQVAPLEDFSDALLTLDARVTNLSSQFHDSLDNENLIRLLLSRKPNLTPEQLADEVGCSESTARRWKKVIEDEANQV